MDLLSDISVNIFLLFGLVYIMTLLGGRFDFKKPLTSGVTGVVIGMVTIFIIMNAYEHSTGAIFDARSVIIAVTTLFFPGITSLVATIVASAYRIYLGGIGVYAGTLSIILPFLIGLIWKHYIAQRLKMNRVLQFYLFGLTIHVGLILSQFAFPFPQSLEMIVLIGPVMILVFPVITMFLCIALRNHQIVLDNQKLLVTSERRYRTLFNTSKLGLIQYDKDGVVELANQAFANILKTSVDKLEGLDMTTLPNKKIVMCVQDSINGSKTNYQGDYQSALSGYELPVRAQFSPIYEGNTVIGGICILEDLTEQIEHQKDIDRLKKLDPLTNLYNRTSFDEILYADKDSLIYPVILVMFDINSFQVFNTTFGYDEGNELLKIIAGTIQSTIKDYDNVKAYRTGGDEFSIIIMGQKEAKVKEIIHDIQLQFALTQKYSIELKLGYGYSIANDASKTTTETFNEATIKLQENKVYEGSSISKKTVDIIMSTLFEKSSREKIHSERVSQLSEMIAKAFSEDDEFISRVKIAARLHDIGKINIAESILDKPGKLTDEEYEQIKKHPTSGYKILASVPEYLHIANIVYAHHERYDGQGYPRGLGKKDIPLEARIIAVADSYDAMTEQRTYRKVFSKTDALQEIHDCSGTQFDSDITEKFLNCMDNKKLK